MEDLSGRVFPGFIVEYPASLISGDLFCQGITRETQSSQSLSALNHCPLFSKMNLMKHTHTDTHTSRRYRQREGMAGPGRQVRDGKPPRRDLSLAKWRQEVAGTPRPLLSPG